MAKPIQLYSLATPNGQKVSVALDELGLPYETHVINISKGDQFTDEFKRINPNSKIPAIVDPDGPGGKELALFESGAILLYLAEKTGKLLPADPAAKWETVSWLMFQMGGVGPMFGQFGHFTKYAPEKVPYAIERYTKEAKRLLSVLEARLTGRQYIMGDDYTIADIATFPWVNGLSAFYKGDETLGLADYTNVQEWLTRCMDRPASKTGMHVAPFPSS
jgi:GST-like protein